VGWWCVHISVSVGAGSAFLKHDLPLVASCGLCLEPGTSPGVHGLDFLRVENRWESFQEQVCCAIVANGRSAQETCPEPVPSEQTSSPQSLQIGKTPEMRLVCVSGVQHQLCSLGYEPVYAAELRCA